MPDILHRVDVKASPNDAYKALTTREGLAGWWTTDTKGTFDVGGAIKFRFGTRGGFDMKVLELEPIKRVLWQVLDGPAEWIDTTVSFDLTKNGDFTVICSSTRAGRSRWSSCTIAAPSGQPSCSASNRSSRPERARPIPTTST